MKLTQETANRITINTTSFNDRRTICLVWDYDVVKSACNALYDGYTGELLTTFPCTGYGKPTGKRVFNPTLNRWLERGKKDMVLKMIKKGRPVFVDEMVNVDAPEFEVPESIDLEVIEAIENKDRHPYCAVVIHNRTIPESAYWQRSIGYTEVTV